MVDVVGRAKVIIEGDVDTASVSGAGSKIESVLKKGALTAGAGVATIIGVGLAKGFQRLSSIEDAQAKLTGLGVSAKNVTKSMQNALAAVKGTAFGLGDAATVAAQLIAAGAKPGKELEAQLKTVANTAAAAGISLEDMGSIYAKAMTQANGVQNDVLGQLQDKGIPIYQKLAEQLHVTAGEVFKLASDGKISFDEFAAAAKDASGRVAYEMGQTVSGSFQNMLAALGRLGAAFLGPGFKDTPDLLNAIGRAFDNAIPHAEAWGQKLRDIVNSDTSQKLLDLIKLLNQTPETPVGTGTVLAPGAETPKGVFDQPSIDQGARDAATGAWGVFLEQWKTQTLENGEQLGDIIAAVFKGTIKDKIFEVLTHEDIGSVLVAAFQKTWKGFDEWFIEITEDFRTSFWDWWHDAESLIGSIPKRLTSKVNEWRQAGHDLITSFFEGLQTKISGGLDDFISALKTKLNNSLGLPRTIPIPFGPDIKIPGFAGGVRDFSGGLARVGEQGPELVYLPPGSDVYSNAESQQMGGFTYAPVFMGPTTSAERLQEMDWTWRFAPRNGVPA